MTFGERLKQLREEIEYTQKQVGKIIGVTPEMVGKYERGENYPGDIEIYITLAQLFGVTIDYLLGQSNVRVRSEFKDICLLYEQLPDEQRKFLQDYMEFLIEKSREKK